MAAAPFLSVWLALFAEVNQRLVVVLDRLKPSPALDVGEPADMSRSAIDKPRGLAMFVSGMNAGSLTHNLDHSTAERTRRKASSVLPGDVIRKFGGTIMSQRQLSVRESLAAYAEQQALAEGLASESIEITPDWVSLIIP